MLPKKLDLSEIAPTINGVVGTYISINEMYDQSHHRNFIQDLVAIDNVKIRDALYTVLPEGGRLDGFPSCPCGYTTFGINKRVDKEVKCVKCNQPVREPAGGSLETMFWMHRPVGISRFINPKVFIDLNALVTEAHFKHFNPWKFLTDPSYKPTKTGMNSSLYLKMETWVSDGVVRGYEYFAQNLRDLVVKVLEEIPKHRNKKVPQVWYETKADMLKVLDEPDELLFCDVLPVLNQLILQIEKLGDNYYKAETTELYGRAVTTVINLPYKQPAPELTPKQRKMVDTEMSRMMWLMAEFYTKIMKDEGKKPGVIKSDIYGQRGDFTYRTTVVSIQGPHHADECHLPWAFGITLLTPFLIPRLKEMGLSLPEIFTLLDDHVLVYDKLLDDLMQDVLIGFKDGLQIGGHDGSKVKGIPSYTVRYPTLEVHSGQLLTVSKIKTDPNDRSMAISALGQPGWRGDHDGDDFTAALIIDKYVYEIMQSTHISSNTMDLNTPYGYGRAVELPAPVIQSWVGYTTLFKGR